MVHTTEWPDFLPKRLSSSQHFILSQRSIENLTIHSDLDAFLPEGGVNNSSRVTSNNNMGVSHNGTRGINTSNMGVNNSNPGVTSNNKMRVKTHDSVRGINSIGMYNDSPGMCLRNAHTRALSADSRYAHAHERSHTSLDSRQTSRENCPMLLQALRPLDEEFYLDTRHFLENGYLMDMRRGEVIEQRFDGYTELRLMYVCMYVCVYVCMCLIFAAGRGD